VEKPAPIIDPRIVEMIAKILPMCDGSPDTFIYFSNKIIFKSKILYEKIVEESKWNL
jgi:hypothetical protein